MAGFYQRGLACLVARVKVPLKSSAPWRGSEEGAGGGGEAYLVVGGEVGVVVLLGVNKGEPLGGWVGLIHQSLFENPNAAWALCGTSVL